MKDKANPKHKAIDMQPQRPLRETERANYAFFLVTSQARHGRPSGGEWDPVRKVATYEITPDKEPPLWNPRSKVI